MAPQRVALGIINRNKSVCLCLLLLASSLMVAHAAPVMPTSSSPGSISSPGPVQPSSTVTLSWSASGGATYYDLGVRDMSSGTLVVDTTTPGTSYTVTLTAGKTYRWNVAAANSTGESSFTTALYFQTPTPLNIPATPTIPSPGSISTPGPVQPGSTVTLSWNASSGATYYDLGVRDMTSGTLVVDTTTTATSYTVTLQAGRTYRWNVAAGNSAGESSFTAPIYFQIMTPPPLTPTGPSPGSSSSPGPALSSPAITLSWNASSGATYYDLGVRDMTTGNLVVNTTTAGTSYTVTLQAGRTYRWNVAAGNSAGESLFTTPLYFQIITPPPVTPTSPSPGSISSPGALQSSSTVTLSWNVASGATYYDLGVRDMASGNLVVDTTTTGTNYAVTLTAGKTYRWNVAAGNSAGESLFTTPLYFQTLDTNTAEYPGAVWIPAASTNITVANRTSPDVRWIVIHTTEGTTASAIQRFQNPAEQASAHYIISRDGSVTQLVQNKDISFGAGNYSYNTRCINIEHERYDTSDVTPAEYAASAQLVKWLASRYNVQVVFPGVPEGIAPADPASGTGVIGHRQVPDPTNPALGGGLNHHTDPVNWDWVYYQSLFATTAPPFFSGVGGGALLPPSNGQFQFEIHGNSGQMTVQVSDDMKNWIDAGTVSLVNGKAVFTDPSAGAHLRRFYRLKP
jgi:hypothetical protein